MYLYGIVCRGIINYTIIYGIYVRSWPTPDISELLAYTNHQHTFASPTYKQQYRMALLSHTHCVCRNTAILKWIVYLSQVARSDWSLLFFSFTLRFKPCFPFLCAQAKAFPSFSLRLGWSLSFLFFALRLKPFLPFLCAVCLKVCVAADIIEIKIERLRW